MPHYQVRAVLASGSQMFFGVQAADGNEAKLAAAERLPESGHPVRELTVEPVLAPSER